MEGVLEEEPNLVENEINTYFKKRFVEELVEQPKLDGVEFKYLSSEANLMLITKFNEEKVNDAIWECGNSKSLGLDDFTFLFIKVFLGVIEIRCFEILKGIP